MRIAIIGSGVSGCTAAYALRDGHELALYEQDGQPGGHVHTVRVPQADGRSIAVDMGFIVYNEPTYPRFSALLAELGVATQPTEMSFGHRCHRCDMEFGSMGIGAFLATRRAALRPAHWRMVVDLVRFHREARRRLESGGSSANTLAELLDEGAFGEAFRHHFALPVVSAIWSMGATGTLDFPADTLLRFLDNHGLIGFGRAKPWRTIVGGSSTYVERIVERLPAGTLRVGSRVVAARRDPDGVTVHATGRPAERFDALILATHADDALRILGDADPAEIVALDRFEYTQNEVVLHGDDRLLPRRARARGSWNVDTLDCRAPTERLTMTYDMRRLQRLDGVGPVLVSVNPGGRLAEDRIIASRPMRHPRYTFRTLEGQRAVSRLQGHRRTWYAGSHLGYGFHEDGCRSGYEAAEGVDGLVARMAA
jgi:predicted NAD/FAD-binding protein